MNERDGQVALRLKAARWLAGEVVNGKAQAMSTAALAGHQELVRNGITKNRLEEIEQLRTAARPMELDTIARALDLPSSWFSDPSPTAQPSRPVEEFQRLLADLGLTLSPSAAGTPSASDDPDHPDAGAATGA